MDQSSSFNTLNDDGVISAEANRGKISQEIDEPSDPRDGAKKYGTEPSIYEMIKGSSANFLSDKAVVISEHPEDYQKLSTLPPDHEIGLGMFKYLGLSYILKYLMQYMDLKDIMHLRQVSQGLCRNVDLVLDYRDYSDLILRHILVEKEPFHLSRHFVKNTIVTWGRNDIGMSIFKNLMNTYLIKERYSSIIDVLSHKFCPEPTLDMVNKMIDCALRKNAPMLINFLIIYFNNKSLLNDVIEKLIRECHEGHKLIAIFDMYGHNYILAHIDDNNNIEYNIANYCIKHKNSMAFLVLLSNSSLLGQCLLEIGEDPPPDRTDFTYELINAMMRIIMGEPALRPNFVKNTIDVSYYKKCIKGGVKCNVVLMKNILYDIITKSNNPILVGLLLRYFSPMDDISQNIKFMKAMFNRKKIMTKGNTMLLWHVMIGLINNDIIYRMWFNYAIDDRRPELIKELSAKRPNVLRLDSDHIKNVIKRLSADNIEMAVQVVRLCHLGDDAQGAQLSLNEIIDSELINMENSLLLIREIMLKGGVYVTFSSHKPAPSTSQAKKSGPKKKKSRGKKA